MSAHTIYDCASLGSVIRYCDRTARPPARFRKKLSAWESRNGTGRLAKKEPPRERPTYTSPACFTLHEGDFGQGGIIVVSPGKGASARSRRRSTRPATASRASVARYLARRLGLDLFASEPAR